MGKGKGRFVAYIEGEDGSAMRISIPTGRRPDAVPMTRLERRVRAFSASRRERNEIRSENREARLEYGVTVR